MELPVNAVQSRTQDLNEADSQTHLYLFNMSAIYPTTAVAWSANACDSVKIVISTSILDHGVTALENPWVASQL